MLKVAQLSWFENAEFGIRPPKMHDVTRSGLQSTQASIQTTNILDWIEPK